MHLILNDQGGKRIEEHLLAPDMRRRHQGASISGSEVGIDIKQPIYAARDSSSEAEHPADFADPLDAEPDRSQLIDCAQQDARRAAVDVRIHEQKW
jgi:hypothetical protein